MSTCRQDQIILCNLCIVQCPLHFTCASNVISALQMWLISDAIARSHMCRVCTEHTLLTPKSTCCMVCHSVNFVFKSTPHGDHSAFISSAAARYSLQALLVAGNTLNGHLPLDPALTPAMFTDALENPVRGNHPLTDADLQNLLNQEWGSRVLTIVSSRNWHHMLKETDACQYMATRCCLCDQFLGRIQDLHRHYKTQHPEYWPHVQAKGIQLSNLHNSEEPPCRYCNWPFKTSHQCPIWLQLAMLLIYGGSAQNPAQSPAIQRCEICAESFSSSETLHAHLVTEHRLISSSFNAARDSLEGEPVCDHLTPCTTTWSHCGHT